MAIELNEVVTLEDVQLYSEGDAYFLKISYIVGKGVRKKRVVYPKVPLPIYQDRLPEITTDYCPVPNMPGNGSLKTEGDFGFGVIQVFRLISPKSDAHAFDDDMIPLYEEEIKEDIHDFTVNELEKILGGKIRIVKEKS